VPEDYEADGNVIMRKGERMNIADFAIIKAAVTYENQYLMWERGERHGYERSPSAMPGIEEALQQSQEEEVS
jgi:hypothetical protein